MKTRHLTQWNTALQTEAIERRGNVLFMFPDDYKRWEETLKRFATAIYGATIFMRQGSLHQWGAPHKGGIQTYRHSEVGPAVIGDRVCLYDSTYKLFWIAYVDEVTAYHYILKPLYTGADDVPMENY